MEHIKTLNTKEFTEHCKKRWMWRVPDFLPVRM